jgi:hypothetical protein
MDVAEDFSIDKMDVAEDFSPSWQRAEAAFSRLSLAVLLPVPH